MVDGKKEFFFLDLNQEAILSKKKVPIPFTAGRQVTRAEHHTPR